MGVELLWPPQLRLGMEASTYDKVKADDDSLFVLFKARMRPSVNRVLPCRSACFSFSLQDSDHSWHHHLRIYESR